MADKKQTLTTPDGRKYVALNEREATRLIRTAGYKPAKAKAAPKPAEQTETKSTTK